MSSSKLRKISKIVKEISIQSSQSRYDISGLDLSLCKFYYRVPQNLFKDLASGDYTIDTSNESKTLVIQNPEVLKVAEAIQICYVVDLTSSRYEAEFNVDINQLNSNYNKLVDDVHVLWEYVKKVSIVADDTTIPLILPQLNTDEVWVKTEDGYKGVSLTDAEGTIKEVIERYTNEMIDKIDKDSQGIFDKEVEQGKKEITEHTILESHRITDVVDNIMEQQYKYKLPVGENSITLPDFFIPSNKTKVFVNGLLLLSPDDYNISNKTITLNQTYDDVADVFINCSLDGKINNLDIVGVNVLVDDNIGIPSATGIVESDIITLNFKNLKGNDGKKGDKGEKGDKPVKGVDYYTEAEKQQFTTETVALVGAEGQKVINEIKQIVEKNPAEGNALSLSGKTRAEFDNEIQGTIGEYKGVFPLTEAQYNGIYWDSTTRNYYRCIKAYKGDEISFPNMSFEKISMSTNKEEINSLKGVLNGESYSILSWESGTINYVSETEPFIYKDSSNIIRTPQNLFYNLKVGDRISFSGIELYKMQIRIVYDDGTYGTYSPLDLTEYIVSRNAKYQIVVLSNDASSLRDKVEEVGSLVTIATYDKGMVGEIENIETRVEVLEKQNQLVDTKNKYSVTNICSENYFINQLGKGFIANNCVGIEEDGWFKITPNVGRSYCSIYYYSDNFKLKSGKYLVTYTMKVDNTTGILKTVRGRVFNGDSGKNVFTVPKGDSIYGVRKTQSLVITTGKEYDSLSLYFEFNQAITEENIVDIYVKDISMINIDELYTQYCGYSIANAIEGQLNGFVNGTQVLDMSLESLYPIWNHSIGLFGDSIFDLGTIDERLAINTKARVYNCAKGGETAVYGQISPSWKTESVFTLYKISESIKSGDWSSQIAQNENKGNLLKSIDFNNLDYMFILIGTNDWRRNPKIGENDSIDVTTFKGAINVVLDNILSTYPDINIVLMTPLFRMEFGDSDTTPNDSGTYLYEIGNAMIDIAKKYHLPYFNTYYEGGVNKYNHQIYLSDKTHPTTAYDEKLATIIENIIKSKCLRSFGRELG